MNENLKSGNCINCGSSEIYTDKGLSNHLSSFKLYASSMRAAILNSYICLNCGKVEAYLDEKDLEDSVKEKFCKNWKKVEPTN